MIAGPEVARVLTEFEKPRIALKQMETMMAETKDTMTSIQ